MDYFSGIRVNMNFCSVPQKHVPLIHPKEEKMSLDRIALNTTAQMTTQRNDID